MIGLFTIAIIGFATNFAIDNNSEVSVLDDPEFSTLNNSVSTNVGSFRGASESTYQSIIESSIEQADTTPSGGQFAITPTSSVAVTKNILEVGYIKIFGNGEGFGIFITTFLGLITFIFGLLIWKTWAGRNPE
jgi:hypothetical protein|tara:strand:+ start:6880 stop:7278 length:399 start_codon:yes stop_codon:yes gene_type:complete